MFATCKSIHMVKTCNMAHMIRTWIAKEMTVGVPIGLLAPMFYSDHHGTANAGNQEKMGLYGLIRD